MDKPPAVPPLGVPADDAKHAGLYSASAASDVEHDQTPPATTAAHQLRMQQIYRKLDRRIIPPFWLLYFLCSAVRANVGLAQTMNVAEHHSLSMQLHLTPHQLSTGLALFYAAYVVLELPSTLAMSRLGQPGAWLARIVISVGVVGAAMAGMRGAGALYALRTLLGGVEAGLWPGLTLFLTLFYPPHAMARRVGYYFTASQVSAAAVGLVSAGFQRMDGVGGLVGFQWMFLLWGLATLLVGVALLWWLPGRPRAPGESARERSTRTRWWRRLVPRPRPALSGEDALLHYRDLSRAYRTAAWTLRDLGRVLVDWRFWPLFVMYFGVVGVGNGVQSYGTVILSAINPSFSGIDLSLLYAPIWICDLVGILLVTPISDRFHKHRALFFSLPTAVQVAGLLIALYAGDSSADKWGRYVGLLLVGFGLGPTVPITMTWTAEIFQERHGEVGVAAACALVSGLGNLGSVVTNYALFEGWPTDASRNPAYLGSNWVMIAILLASIVASWVLSVLLQIT